MSTVVAFKDGRYDNIVSWVHGKDTIPFLSWYHITHLFRLIYLLQFLSAVSLFCSTTARFEPSGTLKMIQIFRIWGFENWNSIYFIVDTGSFWELYHQESCCFEGATGLKPSHFYFFMYVCMFVCLKFWLHFSGIPSMVTTQNRLSICLH